jgi:hypothetical protein
VTKKLPPNFEISAVIFCRRRFIKIARTAIDDYIDKGYLRKVPPHEKLPPEVWYLLPIIRMDKSTTKVRMVFDCSAKYEGISLNDVIYAGPKLQKNLFDVLFCFRRNPIALACDIKEMFL